MDVYCADLLMCVDADDGGVSAFIFLRNCQLRRESSQAAKGVISGGDIGHDHVVSTH